MKPSKISLTLCLAFVFFLACAEDRPVKPVPGYGLRVKKQVFQGQFAYLKSVTSVESPGKKHAWMPPGLYLDSGKIIRFEIREKTLDVHSVHLSIQEDQPAPATTLVASFPIRHVDILRKQNPDGDDTHEEEVTESRRDWKERDYLVFDFHSDRIDTTDLFHNDTKSAVPPESIELDGHRNAINFDVRRYLTDDTLIRERYSFLAAGDSSYKPEPYPKELQVRFGFFSTARAGFDRYGRVTQSAHDDTTAMNRWDPTQPIVYYYSAEFPRHLKPVVEKSVAAWNEALKSATGRSLIEVRENSGQVLGDLRYNLLAYETAPYSVHGILGYGPTFAHPLTGQILKGDVVLYGGTLRRATFNERLWEGVLGNLAINYRNERLVAAGSSQRLVTSFAKNFSKLSPLSAPAPRERMAMEKLLAFPFENDPAQMTKGLLAEMRKPLALQATSINDLVTNRVHELYAELKQSDEDVEKEILGPLFTHEMGHNLGLRHNFKGSADERHFEPDHHTSSVMDYPFLSTHDSPVPGPYDRAAIQVAYSGSEEKRKLAIDERYFFCSDDHVFTSRDPLCLPFDRGTTLAQAAVTHHQRYYAAYPFNNLRLDRLHFNMDDREYLARLFMYLAPLRQLFDHAEAVVRADGEGNYADLWYLLKERIERSPRSTKLVKVRVTDGEALSLVGGRLRHGFEQVEREVDLEKVTAAVADAKEARSRVVKAMLDILFNNRRSDYDLSDEVQGKAQVRGVLYDKMLTLLLVGAQTPDPLSRRGRGITMFSSMGTEGVADLFLSLISNIVPGEETNTELASVCADFDPSLRELAMLVLKHQLAVPGSAATTMELVRLERLNVAANSSDAKEIDDIDKLRAPVRAAYQELFHTLVTMPVNQIPSTNVDYPRQKDKVLEAEIVFLSSTKPTYVKLLPGIYIRAYRKAENLPYETATSYLLADNLNRMEDRWLAAIETDKKILARIKAEEAKPSAQRNLQDLARDRDARERLRTAIQQLAENYNNERLFAEHLYRTFEYSK